eukprot:SAG11_NODE_4225_length_2003_cov_1.109244_3_plen_66_part_01
MCALAFLTVSGKTQWSGRSLTLLDPTYASKYIPIIASVSEHQVKLDRRTVSTPLHKEVCVSPHLTD